MVMETFGEVEADAARGARQGDAGALVCDGGCSPASVGQSRGARGARVSGVPAREHPGNRAFVRARCVCDVIFLFSDLFC